MATLEEVLGGKSQVKGKPTVKKPATLPNGALENQVATSWQNPFASAASGMTAQGAPQTQGGNALQDYINRMTQQANSAMYGQQYKPQGLLSGNVTGNPQQFQAPAQSLQGLLGQFGNRSWMGK